MHILGYFSLYLMMLLLSHSATLRLNGAHGFRGLVAEKHIGWRAFATTKLQSSLLENSRPSLPRNCPTWLDVELPEGRCVGVSMKALPETGPDAITADSVADPNHWVHSAYHPDEIAYGLKMKPLSSSSFWMGRLALRMALGFPDYAILKDSHGRPKLASGIYGSISHKEDRGIALISNKSANSTLSGLGVDLERTARPGKRSIEKRVLTDNERKTLGHIPGMSNDEEVLLRFRYV